VLVPAPPIIAAGLGAILETVQGGGPSAADVADHARKAREEFLVGLTI
jgi:hypothetical protein